MDNNPSVRKRRRLKPSAPANENIPANAIFRLTDDCLLAVLKWLRFKDVINVLKTDLRFRNAVEMRVTTKDLECTSIYTWTIPGFIEACAKKASRIFIDNSADCQNIFEKLPLFENLKELRILRKISKGDICALPRYLVKLDVSQWRDDEESTMNEWFRALNATLKYLVFNCENIKSLMELHNLEELEISFQMKTFDRCFFKFLEQNHNLRKLKIVRGNADALKGLSRLKQLISLSLEGVSISSWDTLIEIVPENLRDLEVTYQEIEGQYSQRQEKAVEKITRKLKTKFPDLSVRIYSITYDDYDYFDSEESMKFSDSD